MAYWVVATVIIICTMVMVPVALGFAVVDRQTWAHGDARCQQLCYIEGFDDGESLSDTQCKCIIIVRAAKEPPAVMAPAPSWGHQ